MSPSTWNPEQYLQFADARTRPAAELLARVELASPQSVADLGCGPGNSTELLARRWPATRILGVDSSREMLDAARKAHPEWRWELADIAAWTPQGPVDLIFANAALHWLPDHGELLPRLLDQLAPGGVLAAQMPRNFDAPAHRLIRRAAEEGPWRDRLGGLQAWHPPMDPEAYYGILAPHARRVDIWETEYLQVMEGPERIVEWAKGTALLPYLERLDGAERDAFLARYADAVAEAFPRQADGRVLFPFKRIFFVAERQP
ncbi:MAG TPA: trans-aconitate 2-methyltransferase [Holophagaceae bacterium]|nr:trans-aconitate 2-methyltransferase [Holophagaceae bacterium]